MKKKVRSLFVSVFVVLLSGSMAWGGLIDLSDGFELPPDPSAGLLFDSEHLDFDFSYYGSKVFGIYWYNDNFTVPTDEPIFSFSYNFTPGLDEDNSGILAFSIDEDYDGAYFDLLNETFLTTDRTVSYDLSAWSGTQISIQWLLSRSESDRPTALIYNVRTDPVPEPATLILMAGGLLGLFGAHRLRKRA